MYTVLEQIRMTIYFFLLGMFTVTLYSIIIFFLEKIKIKKYLKIIIELLFWCGLVILSYFHLLKNVSGYIPLYGVCFYIVGIIIYLYFFDKMMEKDLNRIYNIIIKTKKYWEVILFPKEIKKIFSSKKSKRKKEKNYEEISYDLIDIT